MTVFSLFFHYLWQKIAKYALRVFGWSVVADLPPVQKYLMIGAHHTSNWDLPILLLMMGALGLKLRWIGKDSLFKGPFGWFMRWLGGIPVERGARKNFVAQIVDVYNESKEMVITISPEGTRRAADHWKTGFYHIARGAQVPVAMCFLDYSHKTCGIGGYFYLSGNVDADLEVCRQFYANVAGKYPENHSIIRFLPRGK